MFPHALLNPLAKKSDTERDDVLLSKHNIPTLCIDSPRYEQELNEIGVLEEAVQLLVSSKFKSYGFMAKEFYEVKTTTLDRTK